MVNLLRFRVMSLLVMIFYDFAIMSDKLTAIKAVNRFFIYELFHNLNQLIRLRNLNYEALKKLSLTSSYRMEAPNWVKE